MRGFGGVNITPILTSNGINVACGTLHTKMWHPIANPFRISMMGDVMEF